MGLAKTTSCSSEDNVELSVNTENVVFMEYEKDGNRGSVEFT